MAAVTNRSPRRGPPTVSAAHVVNNPWASMPINPSLEATHPASKSHEARPPREVPTAPSAHTEASILTSEVVALRDGERFLHRRDTGAA